MTPTQYSQKLFQILDDYRAGRPRIFEAVILVGALVREYYGEDIDVSELNDILKNFKEGNIDQADIIMILHETYGH